MSTHDQQLASCEKAALSYALYYQNHPGSGATISQSWANAGCTQFGDWQVIATPAFQAAHPNGTSPPTPPPSPPPVNPNAGDGGCSIPGGATPGTGSGLGGGGSINFPGLYCNNSCACLAAALPAYACNKNGAFYQYVLAQYNANNCTAPIPSVYTPPVVGPIIQETAQCNNVDTPGLLSWITGVTTNKALGFLTGELNASTWFADNCYNIAPAGRDSVCAAIQKQISTLSNLQVDPTLITDVEAAMAQIQCSNTTLTVPTYIDPCTGIAQGSVAQTAMEMFIGQPIAKLEEHPLIGGALAVTGGVALTVVGAVFAPELMIHPAARIVTLVAGAYGGLYANGAGWGVVDNGLGGVFSFMSNPLKLARGLESKALSTVLGKTAGGIIFKCMAGPMSLVPDAIDIFDDGTLTNKGYNKAKCAMKCEQLTGLERAACKAGARLDLTFL